MSTIQVLFWLVPFPQQTKLFTLKRCQTSISLRCNCNNPSRVCSSRRRVLFRRPNDLVAFIKRLVTACSSSRPREVRADFPENEIVTYDCNVPGCAPGRTKKVGFSRLSWFPENASDYGVYLWRDGRRKTINSE